MFCSSIGLHRISFVRASENTSRTVVLRALEGERDNCSWANRIAASRFAPPHSAPPPGRAPPCPDPPVVCPGFGLDRFGLHRISFVRASEYTSRTIVFGALREVGGYLVGARSASSRASRPAPPRFAPPCVALLRPARGMSGFWIRQLL